MPQAAVPGESIIQWALPWTPEEHARLFCPSGFHLSQHLIGEVPCHGTKGWDY